MCLKHQFYIIHIYFYTLQFYEPKVNILISYFISKSEIGQIMTILPFRGPSAIVKTRLPSHFARSGHIWLSTGQSLVGQVTCTKSLEEDLRDKNEETL